MKEEQKKFEMYLIIFSWIFMIQGTLFLLFFITYF